VHGDPFLHIFSFRQLNSGPQVPRTLECGQLLLKWQAAARFGWLGENAADQCLLSILLQLPLLRPFRYFLGLESCGLSVNPLAYHREISMNREKDSTDL
jgi:hypothetical protein